MSKQVQNDTGNRTKCEVWTRVMGYFRPMSEYNPGKKSEHFSRKRFEECKSANNRFVSEFGEDKKVCNPT